MSKIKTLKREIEDAFLQALVWGDRDKLQDIQAQLSLHLNSQSTLPFSHYFRDRSYGHLTSEELITIPQDDHAAIVRSNFYNHSRYKDRISPLYAVSAMKTIKGLKFPKRNYRPLTNLAAVFQKSAVGGVQALLATGVILGGFSMLNNNIDQALIGLMIKSCVTIGITQGLATGAKENLAFKWHRYKGLKHIQKQLG